MKKKVSANSRLDFVRQNNQFAANALLKDDKIRGSVKNVPIKEDLQLHEVLNKQENYEVVCICLRKSQVIECQKCKMLFYGRISEICPQHPKVTYLLDFFYCPHCTGAKENLKVKTIDSRLNY